VAVAEEDAKRGEGFLQGNLAVLRTNPELANFGQWLIAFGATHWLVRHGNLFGRGTILARHIFDNRDLWASQLAVL
jgi:hypothetical protein